MTDICERNVSIFITRKFDPGGGCKQRNKPITKIWLSDLPKSST